MRKKRILPHIAALIAALCIAGGLPYGSGAVPDLCVNADAAEISGIGVTKNKVRQSETFDITVNVPAVNAVADTVEIRIDFDPAVFEITTWNPIVRSGTVIPNLDNDRGFAIIVAAGANESLKNGLSFTAGARVKSNAPLGASSIRLARADVSNTDTGYSWSPQTTSVSVTVADKLVPVSGKIALAMPDTFSDSATVTLTDSSGNTLSTTVTFTKNSSTGKFEGTYLFSEAESGVDYTLQITIPGCKTRVETVGTSYGNIDSDLQMNMVGDVDGNGSITAADATQILKNVVGLPSSIIDDYTKSVACVEGGTRPTERDATQILRYLARFPSVFDPNP
jgi:hypothetical protein